MKRLLLLLVVLMALVSGCVWDVIVVPPDPYPYPGYYYPYPYPPTFPRQYWHSPGHHGWRR